jgi:NAD(P)-dependent dehydrogenase (short-subunit alcohol dehydrogenase family)
VHNFKRRKVLVTGGTRGIGRATVELFHSAGATVAINGRTEEAVDAVITDLDGSRLIAAVGDLALPGIAARVTAAAAEVMGGLDILINNAGIFRQGKLESFDEDEWDRMLAVNLKAAFFTTQAALPYLRGARGAIVNVASESGLIGNYDSAAYCASKAGLINLTRALALELAPEVRVNCVCPGAVDTDMITVDAQRSGDSAAYLEGLRTYYPLRRMARPAEIAEAIAYLASPSAAYVTGSALSIDGGSTAGH